MACKSIDGQVAVPADEELQGLLSKFVCVRLVQMWGLDLNRFQFDESMTWAVFLMNGDGTIYARYGSRAGVKELSTRDVSVESFKLTLQAALRLHDDYAKDKEGVGRALAGKIGPKREYATVESMPALKSRGNFSERFAAPGRPKAACIHCHMVPNHEILSLRAEGKPIPDRAFRPYPAPDEVGLTIDPKSLATVSAATASGFRKGGRIAKMKGQPILSIADIQWVLHNAGAAETIEVEVEREGRAEALKLALAEGWRTRMGEWRFFLLGVQNQVAGFNARPSAPESGKLALRVGRVERSAANAGLKQGDVIVSVDGRDAAMDSGGFTAYVAREKKKGETLKLGVRRGEETLELEVPVR